MTATSTYVDLIRPHSRRGAFAYDASLVIGASLVVALFSKLAFLTPFSPVPVTGQTFAVLLVGALLGSKRGSLALLLYLAEGSIGLPVFAGAASGPLYLLGPSGGYIWGFIAAAGIVGWLVEGGWDRSISRMFLAMILGVTCIYMAGVSWLSLYVGLSAAIKTGVYPFILVDLMKITLAAMVLPAGWKLLGKAKRRHSHPYFK